MSDTPTPRTDAYSPVDALREEVERFFSTNRFNAMEVTHFYAQARCVLAEFDRLTTELAEAKKALKALTFPHEAVEGTWPLILYFATKEDANGFEKAVLAAQPNLKPHQL